MLVHTHTWYSFDGRVVARLPFEPISWVQSVTHRGLRGDDFTECSFIGLYILCTMSIRQVCAVRATCVSSVAEFANRTRLRAIACHEPAIGSVGSVRSAHGWFGTVVTVQLFPLNLDSPDVIFMYSLSLCWKFVVNV
jgi:hypothetical protein